MKTLLQLAIAATLVSTAWSQPQSYPAIPNHALIRYQASTYNEKVEAIPEERIALSGPDRITMNPFRSMGIAEERSDRSVHFRSPYSPEVNSGLCVFPARAFAPDLTVSLLEHYLEGVGKQFPKEAQFEIVERPVMNLGPAKFRFLGTKALVVSYQFNTVDDQNNVQRIQRAECWNLLRGRYYVFVLEAPAERFSNAFKDAKRTASTMHFES